MSTPTREVINVSLIEPAPTADTDNPNAVMLITDERGDGTLSSAERFKTYGGSDGVINDFGSLAAVSGHARTFMAQSPNALDGGGSLIVGYWRSEQETVPASAATLTSAELETLQVVSDIRDVSDGSFAITVDGGTEQEITGLDFTGVASLGDIAGVIDDALSTATAGATASAGTATVTITSDTTGATSELTYLTSASTGTFVGNVLALTDGEGAVLTQGAAETTLGAETKVEALDALAAEVGFRGAMFIPPTGDSEVPTLASWAQANTVLLYDVLTGDNKFDENDQNPAYNVQQAGQTNYRMLYRKDGNRKFATAYMSRNHVVNFAADSTAQTMHLKVLSGITPESYTQGQLDAAERIGLDLYVVTKNRPWIKTAPGNDFVDNRYNLIAFVDSVETDLFNFLGSAGTKIAQTTPGVQSIVDRGEKTTRQFVNAGVFAPGEWLRPDYFGDRETFFRNIRQFGYYWLAGSLADQPAEDRADRVSPPLQVAVKNAGAIHSADVIINFSV